MIGLLCFIFYSTAGLCRPQNQICTNPDIKKLVDDYASKHKDSPTYEDIMAGASQSTVRTDTPLITWVGVGWEGPLGGLLFAVDCEGKASDAKAIGTIEKVTEGPSLPGTGKTVFVSFIDGEGTGWLHKMISIYAVRDGHIEEIWRHALYESDYFPGGDGEESSFEVSHSDGSTLQIEGEHRIYQLISDPENGDDWNKTPKEIEKIHERYCYSQAKLTYLTCADTDIQPSH